MAWQPTEDAGKSTRFGAEPTAAVADQSINRAWGFDAVRLAYRPYSQHQADRNRSLSPAASVRDEKQRPHSRGSSPETTASTWQLGFRAGAGCASSSEAATPPMSEFRNTLATPATPATPERHQGERIDVAQMLRASNNRQQLAMLQNEVMSMKDLVTELHVGQGQLALQLKQVEQTASSRINDVEARLQDADVTSMKSTLNQLGSKTEKALADLLRHMDEQWQAGQAREVLVEERLAFLEASGRPQVVPPLPDLQLLAQIQRLEEDLSGRVKSLEEGAPADGSYRLQHIEDALGKCLEQDARLQQWEESVSARFRNLEQGMDQAMTQHRRLQDLEARLQDVDLPAMKSVLNQLSRSTEQVLADLARRTDEQWHSGQARDSLGQEVRERLAELERSLAARTADQSEGRQLSAQVQCLEEGLRAAGDSQGEVLAHFQQLQDAVSSRFQVQEARLQARLQDAPFAARDSAQTPRAQLDSRLAPAMEQPWQQAANVLPVEPATATVTATAPATTRQRTCQCGKVLFGHMESCFQCRASMLSSQQEERSSRWLKDGTAVGGARDHVPDRYRTNFC